MTLTDLIEVIDFQEDNEAGLEFLKGLIAKSSKEGLKPEEGSSNNL